MQKIVSVHPGEVLKTEFLDPFSISAYKLAKDIHVPLNRITSIIAKAFLSCYVAANRSHTTCRHRSSHLVPKLNCFGYINGQRGISTETALMLSKYFGLSSGFWIRMQAYYDEIVTKEKIKDLLVAIHPIHTIENNHL